jgi:Tol biopolymer transport system component
MKAQAYFIIVLFISLTVTMVQSYHADAQPSHSYAFLLVSNNQMGQLGIVRPNATMSVEYRNLPIPAEWRIPVVQQVSPDGHWIVFIAAAKEGDRRDIRLIGLYNAISGDMRILPSGQPVGVPGSVQGIVWSPNSRYLGMSLLTEFGSDVYVYGVDTAEWTNVTNDGWYHPYLAWSPDASQLATVTQICPIDQPCSWTLEIVNVVDGSRQTTLDLFALAPATGGVACELKWSPDGRYLTFAMGCESTIFETPKDMFIWDRVTGTVENATRFTLDAYDPATPLFLAAEYRTIWRDAETFFISAQYAIEPNIVNTATLMYRLPERELVPLFDDFVEEWAINPVTNQVAARVVETSSVRSSLVYRYELPIFVQILSVYFSDTEQVVFQNELPNGCDPQWSPDGTMLAYGQTPTGICYENDALVFYDVATQATTIYRPVLSDGSTPSAIFPIGWIAR